MKTFAVFRVDYDDKRLQRIGQVELDAESRLRLLNAEASAETDLRDAIGEMNKAASLLIKVPPADDAPKFSIRKEKYGREDPRFFDALQDNLRRWHNLELVEE